FAPCFLERPRQRRHGRSLALLLQNLALRNDAPAFRNEKLSLRNEPLPNYRQEFGGEQGQAHLSRPLLSRAARRQVQDHAKKLVFRIFGEPCRGGINGTGRRLWATAFARR